VFHLGMSPCSTYRVFDEEGLKRRTRSDSDTQFWKWLVGWQRSPGLVGREEEVKLTIDKSCRRMSRLGYFDYGVTTYLSAFPLAS